jgi:hypothetical protein
MWRSNTGKKKHEVAQAAHIFAYLSRLRLNRMHAMEELSFPQHVDGLRGKEIEWSIQKKRKKMNSKDANGGAITTAFRSRNGAAATHGCCCHGGVTVTAAVRSWHGGAATHGHCCHGGLTASIVEEIVQHGLADRHTQGFVVEEVIEHRKDEVVVHAEDGFNVGHEDDAVVLLPAVGDHGPEGEKKEQVQQSSSLIIMFIHGCSSIVHIFNPCSELCLIDHACIMCVYFFTHI